MKIQKVLMSAGIHGNEKTPIFLLKKFQEKTNLVSRSNFQTETLIANHKAAKLHQRYLDVDLNRCFSQEVLNNSNTRYYEEILAQKIKRQIIESEADFILDFHSSSSNMLLTLLLSNDSPFNLELAAYLADKNPLVRIVRTARNIEKNRLRHLFPYGFTVEMGAIAPNVIDPIWFERTEDLVRDILDYLEKTNQDRQPKSPKTATIYSLTTPVYFPTNDRGEIKAMIHPDLQGSDYLVLDVGQPIFINFDGESIYHTGNRQAAIFISESAYFEKQIAFYLATKEEIAV